MMNANEFDWKCSQNYRAKKGMGKKRKEIYAECRFLDYNITHWIIMNVGNNAYIKEVIESKSNLDELQSQLKDCLVMK
jgi:hypothetical protein